MKTGKLTENVWKRSVLKQIKYKREEVRIGAGVGEDCAILSFPEYPLIAVKGPQSHFLYGKPEGELPHDPILNE